MSPPARLRWRSRPSCRRVPAIAVAASWPPSSALVIGAAAAWAPLMLFLQAMGAPRINDVSTDTADPPPLVTTLQMRSDAVTPPAYPGKAVADQQHQAYPDIAPIVLSVPPAEAFRKVDAVATAMGWDVVARVPAEGRIEAIDTSQWFGFHDDIVVRIRPAGSGSRIDIRSKSRVGRADLGANAHRIKTFTSKLKAL